MDVNALSHYLDTQGWAKTMCFFGEEYHITHWRRRAYWK
jgi:hypothetical protein